MVTTDDATIVSVQKVLIDLHRTLDLEQWTLNGIHAWPMARIAAHGALSRARGLVYRSRGLSETSEPIAATDAANRSSDYRIVPGKFGTLFTSPETDLSESNFLVLSTDSDHRNTHGGQLVARHLDPLHHLFGQQWQFRKLSPFNLPAAGLAHVWEPIRYRLSISPEPLRFRPGEIDDFLTNAAHILSQFSNRGIETGFTPILLLEQMQSILIRSESAKHLIERFAPDALFLQTFHDPERASFILAACGLGIPVVDIQHGYADSCSSRNDFPTLPPGGFDLLPDYFWCWSEDTAAAVRRGYPADSPHKAVVGGKLWPECWPDAPRAETVADRPRTILVVHQPDMISAADPRILPGSLIDAMRIAPSDWRWLIRLHPSCHHLAAPLASDLMAAGVTNIETERSTRSDWREVLDNVDCVVAGHSLLALEAREAGLPVVLFDPVSRAVLDRFVDDQILLWAASPEELVRTLATAKRPAAWSYADKNPLARAEAVLTDLSKRTL